jgi:Galactose oxidase, central domain
MRRSLFVAVSCALLATLAAPAPAQSGAVSIQLVGGAYEKPTALQLHGLAGRKYLLVVSVVSSPALNFIPNQSADVGIEFLSLSLHLPGFTGVFNGAGNAGATLLVPHIPELDTFPLYFQLFMTGPVGNKLVDKSVVQTLTMQLSASWKAPKIGHDYSVQRSTHTMTLLPGGKVLTLGGGEGNITTAYGLDSAEMYDLSNEALTLLPQHMLQARTGHTATLLNDGRVLIVGGAEDVQGEPTNTAEVYDPATGHFSAVGSLVGGPRALHVAVKLDDGRVLISGGTNTYFGPTEILLGSQKTTEIFNPATNSFSAGPQLSKPRLGQTVTRLPNGDWLVAGGYTRVTIPFIGEVPVISSDAEVYHPVAGGGGSFGNVQFMLHQRTGHGAALLDDGNVLLAGGANGNNPFAPAPELTWEIWDTASGSFQLDGVLNDGRILPTVLRLTDGRVLIAAGAVGTLLNPVSVASAEIWDPATQLSTPTASLAQSRAGHASLLLPDGTVLVSGGGTSNGTLVDGLTSLEIYQP